MTLTLPHSLDPDTGGANAAHVQANDAYLRDAIDDYHATYKLALEGQGMLVAGQTTAVRLMNRTNGSATGAIAAGSGTSLYVPVMAYITNALYEVGGYDRKFRIKATVSTGAVSPTGSVSFALWPVEFSSSLANFIIDVTGAALGAVSVTMAAGLESVTNGADFEVPTPGIYALGMSNTDTLAANSMVMAGVQLQTRNV
jgi:hypothetical protein